MRNYFSLQYKMFNRQLAAIGLMPLPAYVAIVACFTGLSFLLFKKISHAGWWYTAVALWAVMQVGVAGRNDFLKLVYPLKKYYAIRLTENGLIALPFVLFLLVKQQHIPAMILLPAALLVLLFNSGLQWSKAMPTPFYRQPFEFAAGFRKNYALIAGAYAVCIIAMYVHNFNLGLFALAAVFLTCFSFYSEPEEVFYVWVHALGPKQLLNRKIKTAMVYISGVALPAATALCIVNFGNAWIVLLLMLIGYISFAAVVAAKYSSYPSRISLPDGILLGASILFPPLLPAAVPYFYFKSVKHLKTYLG